MGWIEKLCETYDACAPIIGKEVNGEAVLLPVAHSTANAQIEIVLDERGNIISELTKLVEKDGKSEITIIPVTEDSASRTAGNSPHPLHDKLCYVAGDYVDYTGDFERKDYYKKYIKGLEAWVTSEYSCDYIRTVYEYVKKGTLIKDLVELDLLKLDEAGKLTDSANKIHGQGQTGAFIRFAIMTNDGEIEESWRNREMFELYKLFYLPNAGYDDICFVTGENAKCTTKHPNKIRNTGDKAKLISGNDKTGFTFRGRFATKEEAVSVSYEASQKAHNALRWLIQKQGYKKDGSAVVVWRIPKPGEEVTENSFLTPDIFSNTLNAFINRDAESGEVEERSEDDINVPDTGKEYAEQVRRAIHGYAKDFKADDNVIMIAVDSATLGRMSVTYYHEFEGNDFFEKIIDWHERCSWMRALKDYKTGKYVRMECAPSLREMALTAYGTERGNGYLDCDAGLLKMTVQRLLPCVTGLQNHIPKDIIRSAVNKTSNPLAYSSSFIWENNVYAVTCAMLKHEGYFDKERMDEMNEEKERSAIFGRLLAVIDEIERRAMYVSGKSETDNRLSNAKRYWNIFTKKPKSTFERMHAMMIQAYMRHLSVATREYFEREIEKNINRLNEIGGFNNKPLKEEYLVGYYEQKQAMIPQKQEQ